MASLTTERLKEMEEEMNRFEQEILTPGMPPGIGRGLHPRMIIGAGTYSKVQAQLSGSGPDERHPNGDADTKIPLSVLTAPPPPPPTKSTEGQDAPQAKPPRLLLPPPPPPPLPCLNPPAFVPPQLRSRAPGPPHHLPNRPPGPPNAFGPPQPMRGPMGPPHMRPPGPPGPFGFPRPGPPPMRPPPHFAQPPMSHPASIEKPKVIYSAAPVRRFPKDESRAESKEAAPEIGVRLPESLDGSRLEAEEIAMSGQAAGMAEQQMEISHVTKKEKKEKKKKFVRTAAGTVWEDNTLSEWDQDDFRMFCGDLGNEVTDEHLARAFSKYPTFQKAKVIRDRRSNKTKGYGFVSFKDPNDFSRAMREMNGKYVGNRPIKLRKSSWKDRQIDIVRKKDKEKKRLGLR